MLAMKMMLMRNISKFLITMAQNLNLELTLDPVP